MKRLELQVERLRDADCSVLILGETGTGKSVLARRLHELGARSRGPFIDVNCAGLSREFAESELFGYERGAFTGAQVPKQGLFEAAHGGTLFLDEIGDIDLQVQPKILKALDERRFRRLGDVRERSADVRLVAATHHDLLDAVKEKIFRADLYYRISTVTLTLPPLRERREDIIPLAYRMLGSSGATLAKDAEEQLLRYPFPGNIRELKNVVERALVLRNSDTIHASDLCFDGGETRSTPPSSSAVWRSIDGNRIAVPATLEDVEREHIRLALAAENGRIDTAAKRLGISRSTLYQKVKAYGLAFGRRAVS
jgi:transcriptional regulator with PAS, ATPase and Fis domain